MRLCIFIFFIYETLNICCWLLYNASKLFGGECKVFVPPPPFVIIREKVTSWANFVTCTIFWNCFLQQRRGKPSFWLLDVLVSVSIDNKPRQFPVSLPLRKFIITNTAWLAFFFHLFNKMCSAFHFCCWRNWRLNLAYPFVSIRFSRQNFGAVFGTILSTSCQTLFPLKRTRSPESNLT